MQTGNINYDVAQMVMPRINGTELDESAYRQQIEQLARDGIGGFILFGGSTETTPEHLRGLQSLAETPLLLASDVERGLGQQLSGGTRFPSQRAVAAAINPRSKKDVTLLDRMLDAVRAETRAAGIHIVFSPVMDVNNNPDNPIICTRSFGEDPETVEWFGSRYIKRLQKARKNGALELLACAKHFPGHGDTDQDSHSVLPVIHADKRRLNRIELPPFREAVKDGVGTVMVAHLMVPALDPEKPTTFSKKIVTALLREGMEFDGLIFSDALDMAALANSYSQEEIAVRAVEAGMDILLHPQDARVTINAVVTAVEQGRLTHKRIRESVVRILAAKSRLGLGGTDQIGSPSIDYEKHRALAKEIGKKAVRVLREKKGILPLRKSGISYYLIDDDGEGRGGIFVEELTRHFDAVTGTVLTPSSDVSLSQIQNTISAADSIVIPIFSKISAAKGRSGLSRTNRETGAEILRRSRDAGKPVIVLSFDSPYILDQFKGADVLIAAYDGMDEIQRAAVGLLKKGT